MKKFFVILAASMIFAIACSKEDNADNPSNSEDSKQVVATPEIVDLGLGAKWANFNIGASKPEEIGYYYAWGETATHYNVSNPKKWWDRGYVSETYKFGWESTLNKYTGTDGTELVAEDDVASYLLGGNWRMPTQEEFLQLISQKVSTSLETLNGVPGLRITSKVSGYEGASIFLPTTGDYYKKELRNPEYGYYWSSSLCSDNNENAWVFYLDDQDYDCDRMERYLGLAIRPVWDNMEPVDLGLSVKWASCNLGATAPEEYGNYYAWAETDTKSEYTWENYKWWVSGSSDTDDLIVSKYNDSEKNGTVDNKGELDAEDDAARLKKPDIWRIPGILEFRELQEKCSCEWTTLNGVKGMKFTGPNGNSIFLPAAGYYDGSTLKYAGSDGRYWSSNIGNPSGAWRAYFYDDFIGRGTESRYKGLSIRPVMR